MYVKDSLPPDISVLRPRNTVYRTLEELVECAVRNVLMILRLKARWSITSVVMKIALDSAA